MNESQLVAETIATIKRDGWTRGFMHDEATGKRCILGSIGRAMWGEQWDVDCATTDVYRPLAENPVTAAVVNRVVKAIVAKDETARHHWTNPSPFSDVGKKHAVVYCWNDTRLSEEEILEVLEKVQAEVGVE